MADETVDQTVQDPQPPDPVAGQDQTIAPAPPSPDPVAPEPVADVPPPELSPAAVPQPPATAGEPPRNAPMQRLADGTLIVKPGFATSDNPFMKRLIADPASAEVGLWDRATANLQDSWTRGTIFGSASLAAARLVYEDTSADPATRQLAATYLDKASSQIARYEAMPSYDSFAEGAAALLGQVGGGFGSPEGYAVRIPGVGRMFSGVADKFVGRLAEAATTQGMINAGTDPIAQAGALYSGVQKDYDVARSLEAPVIGAIAGGVIHGAVELAFGPPKGTPKPPIPAPPTPDGLTFGAGDRVRVHDFTPELGKGPYDQQEGTIVSWGKHTYTIRLDSGEEATIGSTLLSPGKNVDATVAVPEPLPPIPKPWEPGQPPEGGPADIITAPPKAPSGVDLGSLPEVVGPLTPEADKAAIAAEAAKAGEAPMTVETLPAQLLMVAREHSGGQVPEGALNTLEARALAEAGFVPEGGKYDLQSLVTEADRRKKAGTMPNLGAYDNSHIAELAKHFAAQEAANAGQARTITEAAQPGQDQGGSAAPPQGDQTAQAPAGGEAAAAAPIGAPFDTSSTIPQTRGLGTQYHGTSNPNLELDSSHYSSLNYYGQGFYTTDALDIANGYGRRGSRESGGRFIYEVKENRPLNIYDAEQHWDESDPFLKLFQSKDLPDTIVEALDTQPTGLRELYDEIRDAGNNNGESADTIQEYYDAINETLHELGYDGIRHIGGLKSGKLPHDVTIYFDPEKDITVTRKTVQDYIKAPPQAAAAPAPAPGPPLAGEPVPAMAVHNVRSATGRKVQVAPVVMDLSDVIDSKDPRFDQALQPRNIDKASRDAMRRDIIQKLDPTALGVSAELDRGSPIINADRMAVTGNTRIEALREIFADPVKYAKQIAAYRDWLRLHGVDPNRFEHPVIVRQIVTDMTPAEMSALAAEGNVSATATMSAAEVARVDARKLTADTLSLIRNADDLSAASNRDFVRAFMAGVPEGERGKLTVGLDLSSDGVKRVRNAVLAAAYDDVAVLERVAESADDDIKSISNALVAAAPEWAKMRLAAEAGSIPPTFDITAELTKAVNRTADLRASNTKFSMFLRQGDAFDPASDAVVEMMRMFYNGDAAAGAKAIAERLRYYAGEARKVSAEKGLGLDLPAITPEQLRTIAGDRARENTSAASPNFAFRGSDSAGPDIQKHWRSGTEAPRGTAGGEGVGGGQGGKDVSARTAASQGGNQPPGGTGQASQAGPATPVGKLQTLYQQAVTIAERLGIPLRQGRLQGGKGVLGQFDYSQGVARMRLMADVGTVAHEMGHALDQRLPGIIQLISRWAGELGPMDYFPMRGDPREGFAEMVRMYIEAPAAAVFNAPNAHADWLNYMRAVAPNWLKALDDLRDAHEAWVTSPGNEKFQAMVYRRPKNTVMARLTADGLPSTIPNMIRMAYHTLFDKKNDFVRAIREMQRQSYRASGVRMNLEGWENPVNNIRLFQRVHQASVVDMNHGVTPYHKATGSREGSGLSGALATAAGQPGVFGKWNDAIVKDLGAYAAARRAEYLYAKWAQGKLPNVPVAATLGEVQQAIAHYEAKYPTFRAAAQMLHDYTRLLLKKAYEGNIMTKEHYEALLQEEYYVPLYRIRTDKPAEGGRPFGARQEMGPGTANLFKRQVGSMRDIADPIESIIFQTFLINRNIAHNDIVLSIANLARRAIANGAKDIGRIFEEIPPTQLMGKEFNLGDQIMIAAQQNGISKQDAMVLHGSMVNIFQHDPILGTMFYREPTKPNGERIMFFKEGGEMRAGRLISEKEGMAMYESLAELPTHFRDVAFLLGQAAATTLRAGIVTDPVFALTNWIKDQISTAIVRPDYLPGNPRGILSELTQDETALMYSYAGGVSPGAGSQGLDTLFRGDMSSLSHQNWAVQKLSTIGPLFKQGRFLEFAKAVGEVTSVGEAGTRLNVMRQVYRQKINQGLDEFNAMIEAAAQASDVMDFSRHGSGTEMIRKIIPFLNAWGVGMEKAGRTLFAPIYHAIRGELNTKQDVDALKNAGLAWFKAAGLGGVLGYMYGLWAVNHREYQDADAKLRASHLILPGSAWGRLGKLFLIPKPYEQAVFFNAGELLAQHVKTGDPRTFDFAMRGLQEILLPPNILYEIPIVKTAWQLEANYSHFSGRAIVPDALSNLEPARQVSDRTSQIAQLVGKALNVSPIKVDFAIGDTFGSWGRDIVAMTDQVAQKTVNPNAAAIDDSQMFGYRRFIKDSNAYSEATRAFYNIVAAQTGSYGRAKGTYEDYLAHQLDDQARQYLSHLPADQKAYVTLSSAVKDDGKTLAFTAADRRLNPYVRAATAAQVITHMVKSLQTNALSTQADLTAIPMNPDVRRTLIDNLRDLQNMEFRNAMAIMNAPGYAGAKLLSTVDSMNVIMAINPAVGIELAQRYGTNRIAPIERIAKAWPEAQKRLLRDGGKADLGDLVGYATQKGYEFGVTEETRQTKSRKRRISIEGDPNYTPEPLQAP